MSLDHGKNFADRPGMQPWRLINTDMVDIRVTAHIDIGERAVKTRPWAHVGVFPLGQIDQPADIRGSQKRLVPSKGTTSATGILFRFK